MVAYTFLKANRRDPRAGGGAYIRSLAEALRQAGHDAAIEEGVVAHPGRIVVVDGLAMADLVPAGATGAVGLVHHVPAAAGHDDGAPAFRALLHDLRHVVATSAIAAAHLAERYGVANERLTVITPGVPDAPRSLGSGGPCCEILSLGALVPRKGHAVLIEALHRLFDLDWRLTIVGDMQRDPATTAALQALVGDTDRVRFTGPLDDAALETWWRKTDLFALATEWEGHAAAVAEALRRGLPVAVTAGGAAAALVTPKTGIVCEVGDVTQLSRALRRLVFDVPLRTQMASAAWRAGQDLSSWSTQAARFVAATT